MTTSKDLEHIAELAGNDPLAQSPTATILSPDVRSGATFPFKGSGNADDAVEPFLVVWVYSVPVSDRQKFADAVIAFEKTFTKDPPALALGLGYRGTYSVSISSAAPEFEYRTVWSLTSLQNLQTLNDAIADPARAELQSMIKLIDLRPPMRAEILGLAKFTKIAGL